MENIPKTPQSASEKLKELRAEKDRVMELMRKKTEGVNENWIKQRYAEGEEKERLIQEVLERHRELDSDKEYQELEERSHRLLYDIFYWERQEMIGMYYFTQSVLRDIENAFVDLPPNDPRIDECIERMEEIQKLLKDDQAHMATEGVIPRDFDDYNK